MIQNFPYEQCLQYVREVLNHVINKVRLLIFFCICVCVCVCVFFWYLLRLLLFDIFGNKIIIKPDSNFSLFFIFIYQLIKFLFLTYVCLLFICQINSFNFNIFPSYPIHLFSFLYLLFLLLLLFLFLSL